MHVRCSRSIICNSRFDCIADAWPALALFPLCKVLNVQSSLNKWSWGVLVYISALPCSKPCSWPTGWWYLVLWGSMMGKGLILNSAQFPPFRLYPHRLTAFILGSFICDLLCINLNNLSFFLYSSFYFFPLFLFLLSLSKKQATIFLPYLLLLLMILCLPGLLLSHPFFFFFWFFFVVLRLFFWCFCFCFLFAFLLWALSLPFSNPAFILLRPGRSPGWRCPRYPGVHYVAAGFHPFSGYKE